MPKHFFTSDIHFGHVNVLKFDQRPWTDINQHDKDIVSTWNEQVSHEDHVWYLGDFGMRNAGGYLEDIMKQLKGNIHCIKGNHDKPVIVKLYERYGTYHGQLAEWKHPETDQRVVLCHYAMRVWNQSHRGAFHLYGHSHGSLPEDPHSLSFDVGINTNKYRLYEWDDVVERMKKKKYKPVDHHGEETRYARAN